MVKDGAVGMNRSRGYGRQRGFVRVPAGTDANSNNDIITSCVIAWSFYPKLLVREGKGWRNVASNQTVTLHPTSVNKGNQKLKYLSYYSIMASNSKFYNALVYKRGSGATVNTAGRGCGFQAAMLGWSRSTLTDYDLR